MINVVFKVDVTSGTKIIDPALHESLEQKWQQKLGSKYKIIVSVKLLKYFLSEGISQLTTNSDLSV